MYVCNVCARILGDQKRAPDTLKLDLEASCGCYELNPGSLQEPKYF